MSTQQITADSRIARNTIFLYLRMIFTMVVTLYTSRVVLQVLGVQNYGIYNVIGGIVVLLSIVNNSMTSATQRFLMFELGQGNIKRVSDTFSMSLIFHFIISCVVLILSETIGLWYILNELVIPDGRHTAVVWVYHISIATVIVNIIRAPYNALVVAYEKMSFYAYISILEVVLKLGVVYLLKLCVYTDNLISYSILILLTSILVLIVNIIYCKHSFPTCVFCFLFEKDYFKNISKYLGWNLLGATASMGTQQAGTLILNRFVGVTVNAAFGIASQVNNAIYSFVSNFQVASTPQLVKLFSQGDLLGFNRLANKMALLSYYLLLLVAGPFFYHIDLALSVWLVEVPEYAGVFCRLLIIYSLIDAIQAPLWIEINASGKIKWYTIWLSSILILNIPLSIIMLKFDCEPYSVLLVRVGLNILTAVIRIIHVKLQFGFPVNNYLLNVIMPAFGVTILALLLVYIVPDVPGCNKLSVLVLNYLIGVLIIGSVLFFVGLSQGERKYLKNIIIKNS